MKNTITLDAKKREIYVNGKEVECTSIEFDILKLLQDADGSILSRDRILEGVWGYDETDGVGTRTVDQHVARLRKKLGRGRSAIRTVPSHGYKFSTKS